MRQLNLLLIWFVSTITVMAQPTEREAANIALIKKFYDQAWNGGNHAFADEVFAYPYLRHDMSEEVNNEPDTIAQSMIARDVTAMYDDFAIKPHLLVAKDDIVTARWTLSGKLNGMGRVLSLGKPMKVSGTNIFRIKDGKVVEIWINRDDFSLLEQAGFLRLQVIKGFVMGTLLTGVLWFISHRRRKIREQKRALHKTA